MVPRSPTSSIPFGAGPYKFRELIPGQRLVIGKDKSHPMWKQYPQAPDEIVFRIMREPEQRVTALLNNEIQIAQFVPPHLRERVERSANHKIVKFHTAELMFLAMMPKVKPWDNKLVRQAVAYAIDRDMIIKTLLRGEASRLDGPIGEGQYGYDPKLQPKYTYNPEKAKELLKQAGYPNGVDVELQTPVGRYTLDKQVSEAMIPMLNAGGLSRQARHAGVGDAVGQRASRQGAVLLHGPRRCRRSERGAIAILRNRRLAAHRLLESQGRRITQTRAANLRPGQAQESLGRGDEPDHRRSAGAFSLAPPVALRHGKKRRLPAAAERAHLWLEYEGEIGDRVGVMECWSNGVVGRTRVADG